ncbi:MAG: methyltransferase [Myxococcota bacterium]
MDAVQDDETVDKLIGTWSVIQLRRGHRFSTDDLVTAWRAWQAVPDAATVLDLGCGIGSVGLSTLYYLPPTTTLIGVEAQEVSVGLARRTVALNGLTGRVTIVQGDLRDPAVLAADARFPLITGSPPYLPAGTGLLSANSQRAHARIELRGSVFDYCAAAARHLAPGGRFCFVMLADDPRTEAAPAAAGLVVVERWEYVFGRGRRPHVATLVCAHAGEVTGPRATGRLVIRGPDGEWTPEYQAFRREMGIVVRRETPGEPPGGAAAD